LYNQQTFYSFNTLSAFHLSLHIVSLLVILILIFSFVVLWEFSQHCITTYRYHLWSWIDEFLPCYVFFMFTSNECQNFIVLSIIVVLSKNQSFSTCTPCTFAISTISLNNNLLAWMQACICLCLWTYLQFYQIAYIQSCTRVWNYLCICIRIYNSYLPTCTWVGSHAIVKFLGIEGCGVSWWWRIELHNNATSFTMQG